MDLVLQSAAYALEHTREMLVVALILARTMPTIVLTPFLGGKLVPTELKMAIGLMFTILLWPLARPLVPTESIPVTPGAFLLLMLTQVFIGLVIGFVASHIFLAIEMAGRIIDTVRGASMSEVMVPGSSERVTPAGNLFYHLLIIVFFAVGGHMVFIEAFFYSFAKIPLHAYLGLAGGGALMDELISLAGHMLFIAAILSAPVVAATFIADVVFGILNRVAPQLNAYFMSMPVKAMAGIILILVGLTPLVHRFDFYTVWTLRAVERAIDYLGALS